MAKIANISLSILALLMVLSCNKEERIKTPGIGVRVQSADMTTRSSALRTHGLEVQGRFVMTAVLSDEYYDYTANPPQKLGDAGTYFGNKDVEYHNGSWSINDEPVWVANIATRFWSHAPKTIEGTRSITTPGATSDDESFTYSFPANGQTNPITGDAIDADKMDDIIFAYNQRTYHGPADQTIDITFYHALSQVCFAVSPNDGTFDTTLKIKKIALVGVPSSGSCVFHGTEDEVGDKFTWSSLGTTKTYTQSYNAAFSSRPSGWTEGTFEKDSETYKIWTADNSFFCIPHTISTNGTLNGVQMQITFDDTGDEIVRTVYLDAQDEATTWLPGYYYKYKIKAGVLGRKIEVEVELDEWNNYDDKLFL